jgi:D-alanine-D-alanine ligase-like ATP-grasp enzyme/L-alanine-DL-glutamate epimerase-like enolase superfamily enzyme
MTGTEQQLRLTRVRAVNYRMPLKRAYGTARGVTTAGVNFLVQLTAERGGSLIEGVGECQPRHQLTGDGGKDRVAAWRFLRAATEQLAGRTLPFAGREDAVAAVRAVMSELAMLAVEHADERDRERPYRGTLLGIEVALLDVAARALGLQLCELLGKQRDTIGISISTISASTSIDDVAQKVVRQVRFPMTRVKGAGDLAYDLRLLEVVTRANRSASREKPLWIDINEALDFQAAAELVRELANRMGSGALPASLVLEGMLPKSQVAELPRLQRLADDECRATATGRELDLRIMPDEGLWDVDDLATLNALGGCRAINIKAPKAGGLLASLDLANAAVAADPEVHICVGGMVGTSDITAWALHNLARALPRVDYLTTVPPQNVEERIAEPLARYEGRGSNVIASQTTPGLGTRLRPEKLAPYVTATHEPSAATDPPVSPAATGTVRTLVFAGDTSLGDVYVNRKGGALRERLEQDPMSFFARLRPAVTDHDALILNLETVLADQPTSPFEGRKPYLGWDSPTRAVGCLTELGVDAVGLANNHTMDFGAEHLLATRARLEDAGLRTFGAGGSRAEAAAPLTLTLDFDGTQRRVHVLGAMQLQSKLRDEFQFYAGDQRPGVNALATPRVCATISELRATDPTSLIVVFPHWGRNYAWASDTLQRTAGAFSQAGADLVIGHGAHMLQQCTFSEGGAVVYSLGNFLFNWAGRFDKHGAPPYGLVARVELALDGDRWRVGLRLYPIAIDNTRTGHQPRLVDEDEFRSVWSTLSEVDLDGSFGRRARPAKDAIGHHIGYSFVTGGPAGVPVTGEAGPPNVYDDAESVALTGELDRRLLASLLIAREAEASGARVEWLASDTLLTSAGDRRLLFKGNRSTESVPATKAVRDKALVKQLLTEASVSTPAGGTAHSVAEALRLLESLGGSPAVVKPARSDRGVGVTVGVSDPDELARAYQRAASPAGVVVEEFIPGTEFRCLATGSECIGVIRRDAPNVVGDATHTIEELIAAKNRYRRSNPALHKRPIVIDDQLVAVLERAGLSLRSVPDKGAKVYVGGAANLTVGGDSIDHTDTVPETVKWTAMAAVQAIPGLEWGGVDVILRPGDQAAFVLEINVNAGITGFHYPVHGQPRNVARRLWQHRLTAARPSVVERPGQLPSLLADPLPVISPARHRVSVGELLAEHLSAGGYQVERLRARLLRVGVGQTGTLLYGCTSTNDLAIASQVLSRRATLRRVLRSAGVRVPPGQVARSADDVRAFLASAEAPVAVLPMRGDSGGTAVPGPPLDEAELLRAWRRVGGGGAAYLESRPAGVRLRVLATHGEALAVLCDAETAATSPPGRDVVARAGEVARDAVRAVPELRWAAVDLVLPAAPGDPAPAVERMTTDPTVDADDRLVAGGMAAFFEAVLPPELAHRSPAAPKPRRSWLRRR